MDNQTRVGQRNSSPMHTSNSLGKDVREFTHDVFTLAELQVQLFITDVREFGHRVLVPGLVLICGIAFGMACFPVALVAVALIMTEVFEISYTAGLLIALVAGASLSLLLSVIGWLQFRKRFAVLRRSQQELACNLRWIKKVLKRDRITRPNNTDNSWRTMT